MNFAPLLPPKPRGFEPVDEAEILTAKLLRYGDHPVTRRRPRGTSPAQKSGLRYQRKVCDELRVVWGRQAGGDILIGPWVEYTNGLRRGYCQPDILARVRDLVYIFEIKVRSTTDAWWQLRRLYEPVVKKLWPDAHSQPTLVNVVKSYDPDVLFPEERWPLLFNLEELFDCSHQAVCVQWRPGC